MGFQRLRDSVVGLTKPRICLYRDIFLSNRWIWIVVARSRRLSQQRSTSFWKKEEWKFIYATLKIHSLYNQWTWSWHVQHTLQANSKLQTVSQSECAKMTS